MTEEIRIESPDTESTARAVEHHVPEDDDTLRRLQQFANMPVRLVVGGIVIAGVTIGAREWFQHVIDRLVEGTSQDALGPYMEHLYGDLLGTDGAQSDDLLYNFIHLKGARACTAGEDSVGLDYLRVRLSEVSAWSLGSVGRFPD